MTKLKIVGIYHQFKHLIQQKSPKPKIRVLLIWISQIGAVSTSTWYPGQSFTGLAQKGHVL
ncbi:MAG TPA: hypothetical protein VLM43_20450, partial [Desulfobacterales bacterium]|nr:hypothetical protein [Desulfobacterales bacterium]